MIADIEEAIIAHLKVAATPVALGYTVREITSYGGEFDEDLFAQIRRFPAIWVTFAGGGKLIPYGLSKGKWIKPLTFVTMVGARNIRGERQTRQGVRVAGTLIEPGAYQMLDDVEIALANQDFGMAIDRLVPGAVKSLYNSRLNEKSIAVFAQEWHTKIVLDLSTPPPIDASNPDWLRLGINYHLTPDDGKADASDLLTLKP